MRKVKFLNNLKRLKDFFWLVCLVAITIIVTKFYNEDKKNQIHLLKKTLKNIYIQKSLKKITNTLNPRYEHIDYVIKEGDTFETIIKNINISKIEKKILLKTISKKKELHIVRPGQTLYFKIDRRNNPLILEFKIELDNKNEIFFSRSAENKNFVSKIIEKNLERATTYKEAIITNSLYNSALNIGIKPTVIIDFARLYGFQVDFQRDIWKNDSFQIIYEEFKNLKGEVVETGDIIYANLNLQNKDHHLYRYEYKKNKIDYFDESGKSMRKTLMKTPINGARLSSSFGKRKHPILGFNKMHTGTDFAAPKGTPIMASGDGIVTRARWCGGGGNCVKIKHNSVYQTVYAHMSKFGRGIKKGVRVKQGQIIGYVGSTGLSTGPHLHYEVIENGKKINSQKLKLPSGKILKGEDRKLFEVSKIKIDVMKSELISKIN